MADRSEYRIAVLPFENSSADRELDYLCEGIAAEILICLARTHGLRVVARSAVFSVDWKAFDMLEAGKLLGASHILIGRGLKEDGELDITVDLIDVETGQPVWHGRFENEILDLYVVQDTIVAGVARALGLEVDDAHAQHVRDRHAANIDAFQLYLRGRHFYWQFSRKGIETALDLFERATRLDESYALAYCGQADCFFYLYMYVDSSEEYFDRADRSSTRALELAPQLAEAHASRGFALSLDPSRFEDAASAFERAIELDPILFEAKFLYARSCFANGEVEKAARLFEDSNDVRPEDYQSLLLAGQAHEVLGNGERAAELRRKGVEVAEEHLFLNPHETRALYMGANGLIALGNTDRGLRWLQRARTLEPDDPMLLYNAACIYSLAGLKDEALGCLEGAVAGGLRQRGWFDHDPNLDPVRDDPRFARIQSQLI
jgi:TolB-like protein/Flp pilus assembly protein TadD